MNDVSELKQTTFSDYVYVLYKWKKFLLINLLIASIISIIIVLLIPNQYKAVSTIMIPPENQGGLGGLTGLLSGKSSIASMGSKLFGVSNTSEDVLLGIINSRSSLKSFIKEFNLLDYYDIDDKNMDKAIKAFSSDISADPNEYGMIDISIINKDPKKSAAIVNYIVKYVDSMNIKINMEQAKNNRQFVEKRYLQNVNDLRKAEDTLYEFQRKYGIVAVPEQLEATVKIAAEIESELIKKEMQAYFMGQQYGEDSPQHKGTVAEVSLLRNKVQELKNSSNLSSYSNVLFPFKNMPNIAIEYLRAFREVEIQQTVLEFVMPMYEQAKVEEQKSMPTIVVIDKAVAPELKYSPARSAIVIGIIFLCLFLQFPIVFIGEKAINLQKFNNPIQMKIQKSMKYLQKFYRIKV